MDKHPSKSYFKSSPKVSALSATRAYMSGEASHKLIILVCILISIISLLYILYSNKTTPQNTSAIQQPSYTPPAAVASQPTTTEVESSDGKWKLIMKEEKGRDSTTYVFTLVNEADSSSSQLFSQTVPLTTTMSIPPNTFSPDDKYLFLKESADGKNSYLVLTASGTSITKDSQTVEIASLFEAKYQNYKITDVTGWGGMNLIVFNTDKVTGGQGPSFWFEVPGGAFIQLSSRFN